MTDNQLKCPNCNQYKIYSLQFRIDPKTKKRVTIAGGVIAKSNYSLLVILGAIGLLMAICVGLFETYLWTAPAFLIWIFTFLIATVAGFVLNKQYQSQPKEFDHQCQICGYKWTTSDSLSNKSEAPTTKSSQTSTEQMKIAPKVSKSKAVTKSSTAKSGKRVSSKTTIKPNGKTKSKKSSQ